jgi:hypothetical protein
MNRIIALPALALLTTLSYTAPATASNFSYTYLETSLDVLVFDENVNAGNVEFEGVGGATIAGSFQFTDTLYVSLDSRYLQNTSNSTEISVGTGVFSLGAAFAVANATDLTVQAGTGTIETQDCFSGFCRKENTYAIQVGAGLRHLVSQGFEISADATYIDADDYDGQVTVGTAARWWFNDSSSIHLGVSVDKESNFGASFGYRFTFNWDRV